MKKLINILKIIFKSKFIFRNPKKYDLIVFDKESYPHFKNCLLKYDYFLIPGRIEHLDTIYISYEIFKYIIINFTKRNIFSSYLISLIQVTEAKAVLTIIDNSFKFSEIAKVLDKQTKFIAVQNASRHDFLEFYELYKENKIKHNLLEKIYIPYFYCFGNYEKDLYKKFNINVKNIYPIGDLKLSNYLNSVTEEKSNIDKFNFDICLVTHISVAKEHLYNWMSVKKDLEDIEKFKNIKKGLIDIIKYTIKFCQKNSMKLVVLSKRDKKFSSLGALREINFFKDNLSKEDFNFLQKNLLEKDTDNFSSLKAISTSKITVGICSTLLKNNLVINNKTFSCNLTKDKNYNFPIQGICSLNDCSYAEFEKRLLAIYSMPKDEFFSKLEMSPNYFMSFDKNYSTTQQIREKLSQIGINQVQN